MTKTGGWYNMARVKIPEYVLDDLNAFFHQRKNHRKARVIKPIFRRMMKKYHIPKEEKYQFGVYFKVMCLRG